MFVYVYEYWVSISGFEYGSEYYGLEYMGTNIGYEYWVYIGAKNLPEIVS